MNEKFEWQKYIELSQFLYDEYVHNECQSYLRSAISRAYYGIFCQLRLFIENKNSIQIRGQDVHQKTKNAYYKESPLYIEIAKLLDKVRAFRVHADYECSPITESDYKLCEEMVKDIQEHLERIKKYNL